jgi:hypothetical protein
VTNLFPSSLFLGGTNPAKLNIKFSGSRVQTRLTANINGVLFYHKKLK